VSRAAVRARIPSRPTLICLGLCGLVLAFAAVDLLHTQSRAPDTGRAAEQLRDQYDSRAWLYAFAILAIVALTVAYRLRSTPRNEWMRLFTNVGVAGVWLAIAAVVLLLVTDGSSLAPPPGPTLMLPVVLLASAAAGTLTGRSEGWAQQGQVDGIREMFVQAGKLAVDIGTAGQIRRSRMEELASWVSLSTLALTALTSLLAVAFVLAQPGCDGSASPPDWTNPIESIAAVTAIGAMAAAVGALLMRRLIVALVGLTVCPVALLFVLASTCAFY
jgi:hypothetical protein